MMKWMGTALAAALLVSGCAKVEGEKFVGHWVNVQTQEETMDIERNGETFMVRSTCLLYTSDAADECSV